jgi:multidrug efflux system outer membrane protein
MLPTVQRGRGGRILRNQTFTRHRLPACGLLLFLFIASGCTVGPDYQPPKTNVPKNWDTPPVAPTTQPNVTTLDPARLERWWANFNDPTLNSLIVRAVKSNLDLRQAQERIIEARATRGIAEAPLLPNLNVSGSYRRSQSGGTISTGGTIITGPTGVTTTGSRRVSSPARDLWQAGFDSSWELDIFGGIRRDIEASTADVAAAVEDRRDVLVTLLSEVALNYMDLRGFQQQIAIARQNLADQQRSVQLTRARVVGGFNPALDVANAEAQVATTSAQIPELEVLERQAIYSLSVLLGREPGALVQELITAGQIPTAPPEVPVGLPSELLRRRPDVRRAERQLAAATARIGVAVAQLFPRFSLTGSLGTSGPRFGSLGNYPANHFWSIGPSVSWPIFDAGALWSRVDVQNSLQRQAMIGYQRTVLVALQDVDNSLIAYAKEQQHRKALSDAVAANRRAVNAATQLYRAGRTDFLNVLDAQRALYSSEDALVQSDRAVSSDLVSLYKALGGGWETELEQPPARPTVQ